MSQPHRFTFSRYSMSDHPLYISESSSPSPVSLEIVEAEIIPQEVWQLLQHLKQEKQELEAALAEARQENHKQRQRLLSELDRTEHTIQRQQQHIHQLSQELQMLQEQLNLRSFNLASRPKHLLKVVELPSFLRRSL